jgi:alkaline phosphatase
MRSRTPAASVPLLFAALLSSCAGGGATPTPTLPPQTPSPTSTFGHASERPTTAPTPSPPAAATLIAAGDVASCELTGDSETGALVEQLDGTVALLGDGVYPAGSDETYSACYDPVWGAWRDRTRPAIGNHDAAADGGAAYFRYFGATAGMPGEGWYSYELGTWHVVVLDSNCDLVGCAAGSAQMEWLADDLAESDALCTLAYWHHPRFSSGPHGDDPAVGPFWDALLAERAELVLAGHEHQYERFAPQAADGSADPRGLRQFTVGTGGAQPRPAVRVAPNSELIIDDALGVLVLTLRHDGYDWSFVGADDGRGDAGTGTCR